MRRFLLPLIFLIVILGTSGLVLTLYVGSRLVAPVPRNIGAPPSDFPAETVTLESESGTAIAGWLHTVSEPKAVMLLLHGIRASRVDMLDRARFLSAHGYHTLLIDLQAHGESPGERITLGHLESGNVATALEFLATRFPDLPIGVLGTSLGGAAMVLCDSEIVPGAIILEAVLADVPTATANRLAIRFGNAGRLLSPLLTLQVRPRLGVSLNELAPREHIHRPRSPLLLIYGGEDRHATTAEGETLHSLAPEPKELWMIEGAAHVDFHRFAGPAYERRILSFLDEYLRRER